MHYFIVRETRARIRLPIGLRCWVYPVGYTDRQNLSIGSSFITLLEQFTQLTLFPSGDNESPKNSRITVNLYG